MRANYLAVAAIFATALAAAAEPARMPPEQFMREAAAAIDRDGPGAAARYMHPDALKEFKDMLLPGLRNVRSLGSEFGADVTYEQLEAMPPREFVERALSANRNRVGPMDIKSSTTIIGSVREGELVHFVNRTAVQFDGDESVTVEVTTLRPYGNTWGALLKTSGLRAKPIKSQIPPPGVAPPPPPPPPRTP